MPYIIKSECPKCKKEANGIDQLKKLFGFRKSNGKTIPQSQCKVCRKVKK